MSSPSERMMANLSWGAFSKAQDLKRRIFFTLMALIVYRLGTYVPLPGVNPRFMGEFILQHSGGFMGMLDMFSGGALQRMTIMTLNLMPYISASIIVQLLTAALPHFESLKKEGESGRKRLNQYTRYGTVFLASFQAYGVAVVLEYMRNDSGLAVFDPGAFFRLTTVVTLVGSTLFLMWLGEQISARGIGNGSSLIIFSGIVANLPQSALRMLDLGRTGALSALVIVLVLVSVTLLILFVVFFEKAHRRIVVHYPKRQVDQRSFTDASSTHLPIKLNISGVIPPIFASSVLLLPRTIVSFATNSESSWVTFIMQSLSHGTFVFMALYAFLIFFFAFSYAPVVFSPQETADSLKRNHGFIPGYSPGDKTAIYLQGILGRLTVFGASYLAFICILPEIVMSYVTLSFYLGGTSLLIVVSVTMDTVNQVQTHLIAHQYEGLMRRSRGFFAKGKRT